jgi:L,D-peptidoglycan transpeptidase YkuD (ErfK/YbiS/YcfS/YnhG family)
MARKLKKKVKIFILTFLFGIPLIVFGVFFFGTPEAPEKELTKARLAIANAHRIIEKDFIPTTLTVAENLYDSAMYFWRIENERFILSRDYAKSRTYAIRSEQQALISPKIAIQNTNEFLGNLEKDLAAIRRDTATIGQLVTKLPVPAIINKKYTRGIMNLQEAMLNKEQKNYKECNVKLAVAKSDLADVAKYAKSLLDGYFTRLPMWKRWADQTIRESAQTQSYAMVVDKFAGKCFVYKAGKLKTTYNVEVGKNWIGDKLYSGDKATPEGRYKVTKKKDGSQTKYFKALLLNYPNEEDKARFRNGIKARTIPGYARIGGLIEIHGGGGRGMNWTDGCIAFADNDMESLYRMIPSGCPVTILGSLQPIFEALNIPKP